MSKTPSIIIKNIYYMLAYAFDVLRENQYESISAEEFDNIYDLLAEILYIAVSNQLKRGIFRTYHSYEEDTLRPHGRIDLSATIKNRSRGNLYLHCEFDDLSEDNPMNQIIKFTIKTLLKNRELDPARKSKLSRLSRNFVAVSDIKYYDIKWKSIHFNRSNKTYEIILNICYFILKSQLLSRTEGDARVRAFDEKSLYHLYEKFVLNYFKKHHSYLSPSAETYIFNITDEEFSSKDNLLPKLHTDITLTYRDYTFIIDTKYYGHSIQVRFDKPSYVSHNLYQIFSYVKNVDKDNTGKVMGALLYAKTTEEITPDSRYEFCGNRFYIRTLDLNADFSHIRTQLDALASILTNS